MSVNIQTADGLLKVSGSNNYDDLLNAPNISDDGSDNLVVSDSDGNAVMMVDASGISTINVMTDKMILNGEDLDSRLSDLESISLENIKDDDSGNLIIQDESGNAIAKFDESGLTTTAIIIDGVDIKSTVDTNASNIADNAQKIATNAANIQTNKNSIQANADAIEVINGDSTTEGSIDKKIADAIAAENLDQYATDTDLEEHAADVTSEVSHITQTERTVWNGKSDFDGNYESLTNAPNIIEDESGVLQFIDPSGQVMMEISEDGLDVAKLTLNGVGDVATVLAQHEEALGVNEQATQTNASNIEANTAAITKLNGDENTEGSVDQKISTAFDEFVTQITENNTIDTYKEVLNYIADHQTEATNIMADIDKLEGLVGEETVEKQITDAITAENLSQYATDTDLSTHASDVSSTISHITQTERNVWNNKSDFDGTYESLTGAPNIYEDETGTLVVADPDNNVIMEVSEDGLNVAKLTVNGTGDVAEVLNQLEEAIETNKTNIDTKLPNTTKYAGSSSVGGSANSAIKLDSSSGDSNTPVYFSDGKPVACTGLDLDTTGNAATATTLKTARDIQVNLGSTEAAAFNGSDDVAPGVTGTLPLTNGGTGATTAAGALKNLGLTATATELNIMDGVTATTSEINTLDGITASTTELNYVKGVTSSIQTQLNDKSNVDHTHTVDSSLSTTSTNPAQNKVVTTELNKKATTEALNNHAANQTTDVLHVTSTEKQTWNNKSDFNGDYNSLTNAPNIYEDGTGTLVVADPDNNVIMEIGADGLHVATLEVNGTGDIATVLSQHEEAITTNKTNLDEAVSDLETQISEKADASHTHTKSQITDFPTSLKNPKALTIQGNGTTLTNGTYDGSAAKTVNITADNIGADPSGTAADAVSTHNSSTSAHSDIRTLITTHEENTSNPHGITLAQLGVSASVDELNYVDGVTSNIQTQLNNKAASSHGNHVPTTETANNAKFLRNDNTWQTVTPANIGAAASSHGNHVPTTGTADNATFLRNDNTWQKVTPANIGAAAVEHTHTKSEITDFPTIANNITTTTEGSVLDARQGKVLSDKINAITTDIGNLGGGDMMKATYDSDNDGIVDYAEKADILTNARTFRTDLASTSTASFDGSANVTPGVTGILPVANGGTGNSSVDTTPTENSTKMVTSGGVYTAITEVATEHAETKDSLDGLITTFNSHTHNYAGSSEAGGAASSALKLTTDAGDANTPVYFSSGVPKACTGLDLNTTLTGTLPIANGGTGATTAADALTNLGAFPAANVVNNLTTTDAGYALDARQAQAIIDYIWSNISLIKHSITVTLTANDYVAPYSYYGVFELDEETLETMGTPISIGAMDGVTGAPVPASLIYGGYKYVVTANSETADVMFVFMKRPTGDGSSTETETTLANAEEVRF